ncbi:MAG TPA: serine hydrolase [Gemmatimonadaceae bacterium]|nr:serine hydrolase [Gemmatimonadaceae bacterium]
MKLLLAVAALTLGDGLPTRSPAAVGMSATRLAKIDHVVERGLRAGGFPGASVVVGRKGYAVWEKGFGRLGWTSSSGYVVPERTIYDIASLTKVVGTTTAIMLLHDEGKIRLDDRVSRFIPAFSGGQKDRVTIEMLLTHRSGLPAGRDIWRIAHTPWAAREAVIASALVYTPGTRYEYSDLGADILAFVAEAAAGETLDAYLRRRVFEPLGMEDTGFRPDRTLRDRIAPTDVTSQRGYPLRGEVHDENAFALGGVAGHAGLFSTATDLSVFAQMMLNGGEFNGIRLLKPETVELFTRRTAGSRALGWDTCEGSGSCGKYLSERAYGHTGFTGTSLWIDPDREMFVILLTNRVHAARARRPAKVIADVRADVADAATLAVMDFGAVPSMPSAFRADRAVGWNTPARSVRKGKARYAKSKRKVVRAKSRKPTKKKASTTKKSTRKKPTASRS